MARLTPATHPGQPASAGFAADLDILAFTGLALVDDPGLPRPRFGDDSWDFSAVADIPAYAREPNRLRVDWTTIADPRRRLCAKEAGLALLQPQVGLDRRLGGARRRRLPPHVWSPSSTAGGCGSTGCNATTSPAWPTSPRPTATPGWPNGEARSASRRCGPR